MKTHTRIIAGLSALIAVALLLYLASAFVNWELSPGKWGESSRVFVSIFGLMFGAMAGCACAFNDKM